MIEIQLKEFFEEKSLKNHINKTFSGRISSVRQLTQGFNFLLQYVLCLFIKLQNLGTLPLTVKKISQKTKFTLDFRPVNALKLDLRKIY